MDTKTNILGLGPVMVEEDAIDELVSYLRVNENQKLMEEYRTLSMYYVNNYWHLFPEDKLKIDQRLQAIRDAIPQGYDESWRA